MAQQKIVGFHQDLEGHWVAELACGHGQHVRHEPPFHNRPWTQSVEGRQSFLGNALECKRCDIDGPYLQRDIRDRTDIDLLVRSFYEKVMRDDYIGFYFTDVVRIELVKHLPNIADFWQKMIFNTGPYQGRTFAVHRDLHQRAQLSPHHFHQWLKLFCDTANDIFIGPNTELAIARAEGIAGAMEKALQQGVEGDVPLDQLLQQWQPPSSKSD